MHLVIRDLLILLRLHTGIVLSKAKQSKDKIQTSATNAIRSPSFLCAREMKTGGRSEGICHGAYGCIVERLFAGSGNVEYVSSVLFLLSLCPLSESGARSPGNPRLQRLYLTGRYRHGGPAESYHMRVNSHRSRHFVLIPQPTCFALA